MQYVTNVIHLASMCNTHWSTFLAHALRNLGCPMQRYESISVLTVQIPDGRNMRVIRILTQRANNVFRSTTINRLQYTTVYCTHKQVICGRVRVQLILCVLT
jgi:hypothetical protein